jgi:hypothetical protein
MPYTIRKVKGKPCYKVSNTKTRKVYAECINLDIAKRKRNLLNVVKIRKIPNKQPACYRVFNSITKKIYSKCTTLENAKKQYRLLNSIIYNKTKKTPITPV